MRDAVARSLPYLDTAKTPMFSYVLGMYAFSLEESGDTRAGIAMAQSALEYNRRDAWALHALSHALDAEGRVGELLELLHRTEPEWAQVCQFLYLRTSKSEYAAYPRCLQSNLKCHMSWHLGPLLRYALLTHA